MKPTVPAVFRTMVPASLLVPVLLIMLTAGAHARIQADPQSVSDPPSTRRSTGAERYLELGPWAVTGLAGVYDDTPFLHILALQGGDLESSYIGGLILARTIGVWRRDWVWEAEVQAYRHRGLQNNNELNAALALHWTRFPWDEALDTTVSFGQGISLASERPPIEGDTRALLHYMHAEIAFHPGGLRGFSLVTRLHHRSGAFGLYGTSGGSNFLTAGMRYRF